MKNKATLYWIGGVVLALGGIMIAVRALNRRADKNKPVVTPPLVDEAAPAAPTQPAVVEGKKDIITAMADGVVNAVKNITSRYMKYRVATKETALNVRQKPDGTARVVSKLPKDSAIFARTTDVMGWLEVSRDGKKPLGFVASTFLVYTG